MQAEYAFNLNQVLLVLQAALLACSLDYLFFPSAQPSLYRDAARPPLLSDLPPHLFPLDASIARLRIKSTPSLGRGVACSKTSQLIQTTPLEEGPVLVCRPNISNRAAKLVKLFTTDPSGFELEDLKGCFVEFSKDQHGSRFLQKELEVVDSDMIQLVFEEVLPVARSLMIDVYGNYVIQKFFDFGTNEQRFLLASKLQGNVVALALHLYGCRVVQKSLETLPSYLQVCAVHGCLCMILSMLLHPR